MIVPTGIFIVFFKTVVEAITHPPISIALSVGLYSSTHSDTDFESSPGGFMSISFITT